MKNYRPKLLVLAGDPTTRPDLITFANLITKKLSLLTTVHIVQVVETDWKLVESERARAQQWLIHQRVKVQLLRKISLTKSHQISEQ